VFSSAVCDHDKQLSKKLDHFRVLQLRTQSAGCFYTHTEVVGQAIQYLSFSCRFSEARLLPESDLEFCSKTAPMLLEGSYNSARMFLQFCSNDARMLCEAETASEQNFQNRDTSKQDKDQFLVQDQGTLRVRVFLSFVLPPPLPSSNHSIKTRLQQSWVCWSCFGWLLRFSISSVFIRVCRYLLFFFTVGYGYQAIFIVFLSLVLFLEMCCYRSWEMVLEVCVVGVLFFFSLWFVFFFPFLFGCVSRLYVTVVVMVIFLSNLYRSVWSPFLGVLSLRMMRIMDAEVETHWSLNV